MDLKVHYLFVINFVCFCYQLGTMQQTLSDPTTKTQFFIKECELIKLHFVSLEIGPWRQNMFSCESSTLSGVWRWCAGRVFLRDQRWNFPIGAEVLCVSLQHGLTLGSHFKWDKLYCILILGDVKQWAGIGQYHGCSPVLQHSYGINTKCFTIYVTFSRL